MAANPAAAADGPSPVPSARRQCPPPRRTRVLPSALRVCRSACPAVPRALVPAVRPSELLLVLLDGDWLVIPRRVSRRTETQYQLFAKAKVTKWPTCGW